MKDEKLIGINEDIDEELLALRDSWGKELHTEFLSDLNRKRQNILLVSSIFTVLISFTIITPVEASISGIKISFTNTQILPILSAAVCFYYLVMYYIGVSQDSIRFYYQTQPAFRAVYKRLREVWMETYTSSDEQRREKESNEQKERMNKIRSSEIVNDEDLEKRVQELKQIADAALEGLGPHKPDPDPKPDPERDDFYRKKGDAMILVLNTLARYYRFSWWRRLLEIIFPIGLSLLAIGSAVWAAFFRQ